MNLGQLVDPEWAQSGYPQRFKPAPRPELLEAARQAEQTRRDAIEAEARRLEENRRRIAQIEADRRAAAKAEDEKRRAAVAAISKPPALPAPKAEGSGVVPPKPAGPRPVAQLAILALLERSSARLGLAAIARGARQESTAAAANLAQLFARGLVERTGVKRLYRYAISKSGREKLARYGLYS